MRQETGFLQRPLGVGPQIQYLEGLIATMKQLLDDIDRSLFTVSGEAPDKPREWMIRCADGVNWNPGHGAGLYQYRSGVWHPLGSSDAAFTGATWDTI